MSVLIQGGTIVTANSGGDVLRSATVRVDGNRIASVGRAERRTQARGMQFVNAGGRVIIPGFVQTHVHLCQTLFRGMADELPLLEWLQRKIFPLEAAHDAKSMYASAVLGIAELIRSGTTTIMDMGSVHHQQQVGRAVAETGLRAFLGKSMMDTNDLFPGLKETRAASLKTTRDLAEYWHGSYGGRILYAVAPRFVLSCTDGLMKDAFEMLENFAGMLFHTHASENTNELQAVISRCGMRNVEFLNTLGVLSGRTCLAHCIHLSDGERDMLRSSGASVAHCPSSNLKLGSGIANVPALLQAGILVSLGADGAPCNNTLDMFQEMRLASLIQKPSHGPHSMSARTVFEMATREGARVLGLGEDTGTIEPGKKADLVILNLERIWNPADPAADIYSALVYSAGPENVESVMVDGRWVYRNGEFVDIDEGKVLSEARSELSKLLKRL